MGKQGNKKPRNSNSTTSSTQLYTKNTDEGEQYAEVINALGNSQFKVKLINGEEVIGKLRGTMTRGRGFERVNPKDWVIVQLDGSTSGKDKYYITHKYSDKDKKQLEKLGELVIVNEEEDTCAFTFDDGGVHVEHQEKEIDESFIDDI
tara:strand:+ start:747 stop:1190 length:444 start_codon:yes stop_codon:yes gene_type:complete